MTVSVILPVHRNPEGIARCLRSLLAQTWLDFEVLVADDGSADGTAEAARHAAASDPRVRVLERPTRGGPGAARNLAMAHASGDILAFIDADSWAESDWLARITEPIRTGQADCTGGPDVVPESDPLVSRCVGYSMDSPLASGGLRWGTTRLVGYLPGTGNMAVHRSFFQRVGPFDERFHDSGEDKEWLFRVKRAGARMLYLPAAPVWHHRTRSLWTYWKKMYRCGLRRVDIWRLWPEAFEWPHLAPALLVLAGLAFPRLLWLAAPVLALDGLMGAWRLRDPRAAALIPLTSAMVPLGYGAGILVRALETRLSPLKKAIC
ncbi:MAG: glycosyltransferase [Candidatus Eremiobacterota bacterium]